MTALLESVNQCVHILPKYGFLRKSRNLVVDMSKLGWLLSPMAPSHPDPPTSAALRTVVETFIEERLQLKLAALSDDVNGEKRRLLTEKYQRRCGRYRSG